MKNRYDDSWKRMEYAFKTLLCSFLLIGSLSVTAQQRSVTGTVTDANGPLAGVSVMVQGTSRGDVTSATGQYTVTAPSDGVLIFNFMGYIPVEIPVNNQTTINVVLEEDTQALDEVVVIGYGVQRKRDVTGSISSLRGDDLMAVPSTNALQALQGKIAGLDMTVESGQLTPGSGLNFNVRGNRSLNASNTPLIMVDGVAYGTTLDINPSDIESIEVLKDASSTAIYGSRGANGVILVTTKRGSEGRVRVSFNARAGINQLTGQMRVFNGEEYVAYKTEAYRAKGITEYDKIFTAPLEREYIEKGYFTDWGDLVIGDGNFQNYELNVTSGTRTASQYFSLGLNDTKGLFKNEQQTRYNFRFGADTQILKWLKMGVSGNYSYRNNDMRRDPTNIAYKIVPISRPYDDDGNFILNPAPGYLTQMSPLADEQPGVYERNIVSQRFFASGNIDITLIDKMLFFKTTFGLDTQNNREGRFYDYATIDGNNQNRASEIRTDNYPNQVNYTWENTLNFIKTWGRHDLSLLAGSSTIKNRSESWGAFGRTQPDPGTTYWYLQSNSTEISTTSSLVESSMVSAFGRVNYKYNEKYIFSASIRADGSSVLAEGNKWGYFPAVSVGWRVNEEPFLKNATWINDLKLRASWGQSGNSAISPYQTISTLAKNTFSFSETRADGYYPDGIANKLLSWETTTNYNIGLDFSFWRGRLSGSLEYYNSDTKDLLMRNVIPGSTGYTSVWDNIGKTNNKGFEVTLSSRNMAPSSAFQWNTDITFSTNKEEIIELGDGILIDEANGWFVGQPIKVIYDYEKLGIWQESEREQAALNGQLPGDIKVKTYNSDGKVTTSDRRILGAPRSPKWQFSMINNFSFKGFDLSVMLYGKFGHLVESETVGLFKPNALENSMKVDYWTPENPTNAFPRPRTGENSFTYGSTLRYAKGDFLKIRDITLGYTFSDAVNKKLGISRLRLYVQAYNFFTFCDDAFGNFDPERAIYSTGSSFPMTRQLTFGVSFNY